MLRIHNTQISVNKGSRVTLQLETGRFLGKNAEWFQVTILSRNKELGEHYQSVLKETIEGRETWRQTKSGSYTCFPRSFGQSSVFIKPIPAPGSSPITTAEKPEPAMPAEPELRPIPKAAPKADPAHKKAEQPKKSHTPVAEPKPAPQKPPEEKESEPSWWQPFNPFS